MDFVKSIVSGNTQSAPAKSHHHQKMQMGLGFGTFSGPLGGGSMKVASGVASVGNYSTPTFKFGSTPATSVAQAEPGDSGRTTLSDVTNSKSPLSFSAADAGAHDSDKVQANKTESFAGDDGNGADRASEEVFESEHAEPPTVAGASKQLAADKFSPTEDYVAAKLDSMASMWATSMQSMSSVAQTRMRDVMTHYVHLHEEARATQASADAAAGAKRKRIAEIVNEAMAKLAKIMDTDGEGEQEEGAEDEEHAGAAAEAEEAQEGYYGEEQAEEGGQAEYAEATEGQQEEAQAEAHEDGAEGQDGAQENQDQ